MWLNWRIAEDWETAAVERAYEGARQRDMAVLAGVLASGNTPERLPGPPSSLADITGGLL